MFAVCSQLVIQHGITIATPNTDRHLVLMINLSFIINDLNSSGVGCYIPASPPIAAPHPQQASILHPQVQPQVPAVPVPVYPVVECTLKRVPRNDIITFH